jgi:hypothetical protein
VRRSQQPLLALVLLAAGVFANIGLIALSLIGERVVPESHWWGSAVVICAVMLDVAYAKTRLRWFRPFAVHTQVPQHWGHQRGPWWGALRYGLRLGVGPATILTSWTWWAGMMICIAAFSWSVVGVLTFVVIRTLTIVLPTIGITSGLAMIDRSRRISALEIPVTIISSLILLLFAFAQLMR